MRKEVTANNTTDSTGYRIMCTLYTDPVCCWSWAMESDLERLKESLGDQAQWTTKMGGLIPSWNNYHDESNSVTRPAQMGPVWMHAATVANRPINHLIWAKDPPASSFPACIAVKCAQLQSPDMGESMLHLLRVAMMQNGENIAKPVVISEIAEQLAATTPSFDIERFISDYNGDAGAAALKADLHELQYHRINRFPSILIRSVEGKVILLQGFRTFADLQREVTTSFPEITLTSPV